MRTLLILLAILLPGCAELSAFRTLAPAAAATAADHVREDAEYALCKMMTVGAWSRAYGQNPQKAAAWAALCASQPARPGL